MTSFSVTAVAVVGASQSGWGDVSRPGTGTGPPSVGALPGKLGRDTATPGPIPPYGGAAEVPTRDQPTPSRRPRPVTRIPERGVGTFVIARTTGSAVLPGTTYRVEMERGLPFSVQRFATDVQATLADPRSWGAQGAHRLIRVSGTSDLRVILATPETTDALCAPLQTRGRLSCRNGDLAVINAWRWANGASAYPDDLGGYRRYVINHEVGHALGWKHTSCPDPGALAPVMVQQTLGLEGCRSNPWPALADLAAR
jgi:hypothetical protein